MNYIIKNHKTKYSIYLGNYNSPVDKNAAEMLQYYLNMAFDVEIQITNKKTDLYIALKSNTGSGVSYKVFDSCILLCGEGNYGSFDAIMEFLNRAVNLEIYANDVISYKKKSSLKLFENYNYVPSFKYRISSYGWLRTNDSLKRMNKLISNDELFINGNIFHNAIDILGYNKTVIKDDWLSKDKKQLCYSNLSMRERFVFNLKQYLLDSSKCDISKEYMVLGMEDNLSWCGCDKCSKTKPSDLMVNFVNYVEKEINMNRTKPIKFLLFAYYNTLIAPEKENCNPKVGVIFAPIKMNFRKSFIDNPDYLKELEKWGKKTNILFAWTYNFYTRRNLFSYDTFNSMQKNYRILNKNKVQFVYDQTESYSMIQTGFSTFKAYLQQKLLWNVNANVLKITKDFFSNYFGVFKDEMMSIFNKTLENYRRLYDMEQKSICTPNDEANPDVYSEIGQTLDNFTSIDDKFINFISNVNSQFDLLLEKSKSETCLYKRILLESVQYRYWRQLLNNKSNSKDGFNQFVDLLNEVGITHYQEGKLIGKNMI